MTAPIVFVDDAPHLALRRRTLASGLDVIVHDDPASPQVAVSVWYRAGSSDERPGRTGLAHLFEHLFKNSAHMTAKHYEVLRTAGASDANASTSADRTAYHEVVPADQLALALWLESDRMGYWAPCIDAPRLATQQSVVRAERRQRYEDVAYGAERFAIAAALYPAGDPRRHLTIGTHDDIQAATVDDLLAWYRTWYVPANATLVIAGDVDAAQCDALVDRYFGSFPGSARPPRPQPATPLPRALREQLPDRFAVLPRIHRVWLGPGACAADEPELDVLTSAWCAIGSGALWRRLVYDTQLAQRVAAWTASSRLGGEIHVAVDLRTGSDPAQVRAILDEELARGIDDAQLRRVVTRREAAAIWGLTGIARRAQLLQRFALYTGEPDGLAAELARYRAVSVASIDAARARWLDPAHELEIETLPAGATAPSSVASRS